MSLKDPALTPDCGPHCRRATKSRAWGMVQTQVIVHCKRRRCKLCHRKPVR